MPHWKKKFDTSTTIAWRAIKGQATLSAYARTNPIQHIIAGDADHPRGVAVGDLNRDGVGDIIQADPIYDWDLGAIYWWEHLPGGTWVRHLVDDDFYGAVYVDTVDLDKDGDLDVIAAAYYGIADPPPPPPEARNGRYAWFENLDGLGSSWTQHLVGEMYWGAQYIDAADFDGDGDLDLCGASELTDGVYEEDGDIVWFENLDGAGLSWEGHDLSTIIGSAFEAHAVDLDGDGDMDVVGTQYDEFDWWENVKGDGSAWVWHVISKNQFIGSGYLGTGDLDNDGDQDILGSGYNTGAVGWWENADGTGKNWILRTASGGVPGGYDVKVADLDGDNDLDALFCNRTGALWSGAGWLENLSGNAQTWGIRYFKNNFGTDTQVAAGDLTGNGKLDAVVSVEDFNLNNTEQLHWWDLTQFHSNGELVSSILDGDTDPGWDILTWEADIPAGASMTIEVRSSNDPEAMGPFVSIPDSGNDLREYIDPFARYFQYRFLFTSTDPTVSPIMRELSVALGDLESLAAVPAFIPEGLGGTVDFTLASGSSHGGRSYIMLGSLSGTSPGTPLPGGLVTLPLNWVGFTDLVLAWVNGPVFSDFYGVLDQKGLGKAQLHAPPLPGFAGTVMHYAFCLNSPFDLVSNAVAVEIIP